MSNVISIQERRDEADNKEWAEIEANYVKGLETDYNLAKSTIPDTEASQPKWNEYANGSALGSTVHGEEDKYKKIGKVIQLPKPNK